MLFVLFGVQASSNLPTSDPLPHIPHFLTRLLVVEGRMANALELEWYTHMPPHPCNHDEKETQEAERVVLMAG